VDEVGDGHRVRQLLDRELVLLLPLGVDVAVAFEAERDPHEVERGEPQVTVEVMVGEHVLRRDDKVRRDRAADLEGRVLTEPDVMEVLETRRHVRPSSTAMRQARRALLKSARGG
jgi:hypothetical protein